MLRTGIRPGLRHCFRCTSSSNPGSTAFCSVGNTRVGFGLKNCKQNMTRDSATFEGFLAGALDLPIALDMLVATEQLRPQQLQPFASVGELLLDRSVRPIKGALAMAMAAAERKIDRSRCQRPIPAKQPWSKRCRPFPSLRLRRRSAS